MVCWTKKNTEARKVLRGTFYPVHTNQNIPINEYWAQSKGILVELFSQGPNFILTRSIKLKSHSIFWITQAIKSIFIQGFLRKRYNFLKFLVITYDWQGVTDLYEDHDLINHSINLKEIMVEQAKPGLLQRTKVIVFSPHKNRQYPIFGV